MQIVRLAKKKPEITPEIVKEFIVRFSPQLPGIRKYYNDQLFLKYVAKMMEIFADANDFVSFSFQFKKWLEKYDDKKKD